MSLKPLFSTRPRGFISVISAAFLLSICVLGGVMIAEAAFPPYTRGPFATLTRVAGPPIQTISVTLPDILADREVTLTPSMPGWTASREGNVITFFGGQLQEGETVAFEVDAEGFVPSGSYGMVVETLDAEGNLGADPAAWNVERLLLVEWYMRARPALLPIAAISTVLTGVGTAFLNRRWFKLRDEPSGDDGIYEDRIALAQEFDEALIKNYKKFIRRKKEVDAKKKNNEPLNSEDKEVDAVKNPKGLTAWVHKQKVLEGWGGGEAKGEKGEKKKGDGGGGKKRRQGKIRIGAVTDKFGNKTWLGDDPKTLYDHFVRHLTMDVHEESHARAKREKAKELGIDLEKWEKAMDVQDAGFDRRPTKRFPQGRLLAANPEEQDLLDWYQDMENKRKMWEYDAWVEDPVVSAEEEIREYEETRVARRDWREWFESVI